MYFTRIMSGLHLHLTVQNKILVHLMDYRTNREDFEVPFQVTQSGISEAVNIQQKHLPRALKKLKNENFLEEKMMHVKGVKQKRKVYFLTDEGISYAWDFINNLMKKDIPLRDAESTSNDDDPEIKTETLEELFKNDKSEFSLLEILLFIDENSFFDREMLRTRVGAVTENGKRTTGFTDTSMIDETDAVSDTDPSERFTIPELTADSVKISRSVKRDIYYTVLKQAWQDGQITKDEQDILHELQKKLGISPEEHKKIEIEIMAEGSKKPDSERIYKAALKQAWVDGVISEDEESLLKELRRTLKISDEQHRTLEKEMKLDKKER